MELIPCLFLFDRWDDIVGLYRDPVACHADMEPDDIAVPGAALVNANGTIIVAREQTFAELN